MRHWFNPAVWCLALAVTGCARDKASTPQFQDFSTTGSTPAAVSVTNAVPPSAPAPAAPPPAAAAVAPVAVAPVAVAPVADQKMIVTEATELNGKVSRVNAELRFVVLSFPIGQMPALGRTFGLYRRGLKVGEVNIAGPQNNESIVADVISGEAEVGDEAREK